MKTRITRGIAAAAAFASVAAAVVVGFASSSSAASTGLRAYGITSNGKQLLTFTTDQPGVLDWSET